MSADEWTDDSQERQGNATLTRAAHDRIGVRKVVFAFSDDLLTTVVRMKWWGDWRDELRDVFASLGVDPATVVRCMLARLPPKTHIGIHHDTGRWATLSHRVHVPVLTDPAKVVFRSGPGGGRPLRRFAFAQDQAFELNNRAKHQVYNGWDRDRVHLIFDWVPSPAVLRTVRVLQLAPGEGVVLTRRAFRGVRGRGGGDDDDVPAVPDDQPVSPAQTAAAALALWGTLVASLGGRDRAEAFLLLFKAFCLGEVLVEDFARRAKAEHGEDAFWAIEADAVPACPDAERRGALRRWYRAEAGRGGEARARATAGDLAPCRTPAHLSAVPNFVILGMMKCGTTSLFQYIMQHPRAREGRQKEPHLFDWRWDRIDGATLSAADRARARAMFRARRAADDGGGDAALRETLAQFFDAEALARAPNAVCGDGSPSYGVGGARVAARLARGAPQARLLAILRDPVRRCMSHYNMMRDKGDPRLAGRSFAAVVREDMRCLERAGAGPENAAAMDDEVFERDYLRALPYGHGVHSFVGRGLYAALLRGWFRAVGRDRVLVLRLEDMTRDTQGTMDRVFAHLGLEPHALTDTAAKNTRGGGGEGKGGYVVDFETEENAKVLEELRQFYEPHEAELKRLMGW
jgi:hypothetical protein